MSTLLTFLHLGAADLVTLQMLPQWPAANILLRRFIKNLASDHGIKHKDAAVRLACVEFTGQLATALSLEALAADREADEVQAIKEAAQAAAGDESGPVLAAVSGWARSAPCVVGTCR